MIQRGKTSLKILAAFSVILVLVPSAQSVGVSSCSTDGQYLEDCSGNNNDLQEHADSTDVDSSTERWLEGRNDADGDTVLFSNATNGWGGSNSTLLAVLSVNWDNDTLTNSGWYFQTRYDDTNNPYVGLLINAWNDTSIRWDTRTSTNTCNDGNVAVFDANIDGDPDRNFTLEEGLNTIALVIHDPTPNDDSGVDVEIKVWRNQELVLDELSGADACPAEDGNMNINLLGTFGGSGAGGHIEDAMYEARFWDSQNQTLRDHALKNISNTSRPEWNGRLQGEEVALYDLGDTTFPTLSSDESVSGFTSLQGVETMPFKGDNGTVFALDEGVEDFGDTDIFRFDPSLNLLQEYEPCDPVDGLQDDVTRSFTITTETSPSLVVSCIKESDLNTGIGVFSPTGTFQGFFDTEEAMGIDCCAELRDSGTANEILAFDDVNPNDPVALIDPLNNEVKWQKRIGNIGDAAFDSNLSRSVIVGDFGARAFNEGGVLLGSIQNTRQGASVHQNVTHICSNVDPTSGVQNFTFGGGGFALQNSNLTEDFECDRTINSIELNSDNTFGAVWTTNRMTLYFSNNLTRTAIIEKSGSGDFSDAAFSFDNRFLYVTTQDTLARYDITQFTGGTTTATEPTAESTIDTNLTQPDDEGMLSEDTREGIGDSLGIDVGGVNMILAGLLIAGMAFAGMQFGGQHAGKAAAAAAAGAVAISLGLGLIPVWFIVFLAILGIAALIFMRR